MMQNLSGQRLGQYELRERLGRGGMAEVYKAFHPSMDRYVAIKVMLGHLAGDTGFVERFKREAQAVGKLRHPHIVQVFDFGAENNIYYMVMEYIRGENLKSYISRHRGMPARTALSITSQLADALDYAHKAGMIHRDIKPANVMFIDDQHEQVVLTDFGIARILGQSGLTASGAMVGTPAYISPEAARGEDTDERADLYGLGIILYECLTGKVPYDADTPMAIIMKHINAPLPTPRDYGIVLPEGIERIILKSLTKKPEDRYQTAAQMKAALDKALENLPAESHATTQVTVGTETIDFVPPDRTAATMPMGDEATYVVRDAAAAAEKRTHVTLPPATPKRNWLPIFSVIAAVAVIAGIVGLLAISGGEEEASTTAGQNDNITLVATDLPTQTEPTQEPPTSAPPTEVPTTEPPTSEPPTEVAAIELPIPPVEGPAPSDRVAAFYYPWYGNPSVNGEWRHWEEQNFSPPEDISSDYYPALGAYSSTDPAIVANHFAWLREAGVGVIVTSWWGQGSYEDQAVPLLLDTGQTYGIKVAFHIEPYTGRTADRLVEDITYLYQTYGDHPAFYRTQEQSRWSPDERNKGLFFLWAAGVPDSESQPVEADYWLAAMDAIHALPDGALVIANATQADWVDGGHFDGLYNYATLQLEPPGGFAWAQGLPPGAWYVPSVLPGFSARRIGYSEDTYVPRQDGTTYADQWNAALSTGVEPQMVTITSFNEWHEGTQIEPIAAGRDNSQGYTYTDFGTQPPDGYIELTHDWVEQFLSWSWLTTARIRFHTITTSDWTTLGLVDGATWIRPDILSVSAEATFANTEEGRYLLMQPLERAEAGQQVEMTVDILLSGVDAEDTLTFEIERGNYGSTTVELYNYQGAEPVIVQQFVWDGLTDDGRNTQSFQVSAAELIGSSVVESTGELQLLSGLTPFQDEIDQMSLDGRQDEIEGVIQARLEANPDDIEALAARAFLYAEWGYTEQGLADANRVIELAPDSPLGYIALAEVYRGWASGDYANAAIAAQEALNRDPNNLEARWRLLEGQVNTGYYPDANDRFNQLVNDGAQGFRFNEFATNHLVYSQQFARAIPYAQIRYQTTPHIWAVNTLAAALAFTGQTQEALQLYRDFTGDFATTSNRINAAFVAYLAGDYDQSRAWLAEAAANPESDRDTAQINFLQGLLSWHVDGNAEQAIAYFNAVPSEPVIWDLFINPPNGYERNLQLSRLYLATGDLENALAAADESIRVTDGSDLAYAQRGEVALAMNNLEMAIEAFSDAANSTDDEPKRQAYLARVDELAAQVAAIDEGGETVPTSSLLNPDALTVSPLSGLSPLHDEIDTMLLADNWQGAMDRVNAILESDPQNAEALTVRAKVSAWAGDYTSAQADIDQAIQLAPDSILGYLMQIDLYWYSGSLQENVDAAYAAIVYALAIEPENPEIVWRLAWIQRETDSLEKAIQNLRRADELGAKGLRYANEAGFLWSNNGQQYPDGYERAVPLLNTWLTYNSWDITASFWLCSALIHLERFDDALQVANAFAPQATDAAEFGNLAYIAYRAGDYEQARQWADTARALSAEAYNATYVLGLLSWYADGNLEQSMSYLDSLQEVDFWDYFVNPEFGHFLNVDRARIFNAAGDSQSALAAYQQALDESGDWLVIYPEMADIQIALGDTEAARQSLIYSLDAVRYSEPYNHDRGNELRQRLVNLVWGEAALDVTHPLTDLQALRGEIPLAVLSGADPRLDEIDQMLLAGQGDAALARINQALEADPDNAQALALRVIVQLAVGGETDAMLADADRAIELAPDQVLGYIAKADTLALNSDDDAGAMATLQTALQIAPDHPELLWRIANVSWATATTEEAADYLNRAEAAGAQGYRYSDFAGYFWYEQGDYARALPLLKTACIVRPYVWICQHYLGALIQTGQTDEALRIAREMTTLLDRQEPDDYDLIAYAAYRAGDYEQARAWAQLAYAYRPEDTSISYLLGLISGFGENDPATAMQYLDVVQPDSYNFFVNGRYGHDLGMDRARIYAHVGDTENARTAYEAALANGGPAEWYIERADFYIALGDTEAARADLQYALEGTDDPDQRQAILDKITALGPAQ